MTWQPWTDIGAVLVILGAIYALGRKIGRQEQKMKSLSIKVESHETTIISHTAQLAQGEGNFRVINSKLDTIKDGQKEMRDLLIQHITHKEKT